MRLLHALGLSLAASGAVLTSTGLAEPSHRVSRDAMVAEFAAPRRDRFDNVIVQLPPLSPVQFGAGKLAQSPAPPAAAVPAPTTVTTAAPTAPASTDAHRDETPADVVSGAAREVVEAPSESAAVVVEPAAEPNAPADAAPYSTSDALPTAASTDAHLDGTLAGVASGAVKDVFEAPSEPVAAVAEPAVEPPAPADTAPYSTSDAPPAVAVAPEALSETAEEPSDAPVTAAGPAVDESLPAVAPAPIAEGAAPAVAHDDASTSAPAASAPDGVDDEDFGAWSWSVSTFVVAMMSLAGFAFLRRRQSRRVAAPPMAAPKVPAAPTAPARKGGRLPPLVAAAREKIALRIRVLLQRLRALKGLAKEGSAEPEPVTDWARISESLRAKPGGAAAPTPAKEARRAAAGAADVSAPRLEASRWEQDREDGVALLEPGSADARALVTNARRKLQAVGER